MQSVHDALVSDFERASRVTERICALPAVATLDWGDQAAACLLQLADDTIVSLTIASIDPDGTIVDLEAAGVAIGAALPPESGSPDLTIRSRTERLGSLGFQPTAAGLRAGTVARATDLIGPAWRTGPIGRVWNGLGVTDVLLAIHRLGRVDPGRLLIAQVARVSAEDSRFDGRDVALLASTMPILLRRTILAIGSSRSTASRWLTAREQEVLSQLTLGKSVRQIAQDLDRSPHTVHDHVKNLHRKLSASSRGELIARALGYIEEGRRIRDDFIEEPSRSVEGAIEPKTQTIDPDGTPTEDEAASVASDAEYVARSA